jgi:putative SOS response-associated peptidase YedK
MCGRYAITTVPEAMRQFYRYFEQPNFPARYNVAPTQPIPVVRLDNGARHFALVRWGLIPSWVKDPKTFTLLINARAETVAEKPAFRNALKRRRCLIPADGFFEWKREGAAKQPYFIHHRDGTPMTFAGLWETWMGPNGEEMETAAIITTQANTVLGAIHDRMPVILAPSVFDTWLDPQTTADAVSALMVPAPDDQIEMFAVSSAVNRVANDDPRNLEPIGDVAVMEAPAPPSRAKRVSKTATKADEGQGSLF